MVTSPVQTSMASTSPAKARPSRLVTTAKSPKNQRSGQTTEIVSVSWPRLPIEAFSDQFHESLLA